MEPPQPFIGKLVIHHENGVKATEEKLNAKVVLIKNLFGNILNVY